VATRPTQQQLPSDPPQAQPAEPDRSLATYFATNTRDTNTTTGIDDTVAGLCYWLDEQDGLATVIEAKQAGFRERTIEHALLGPSNVTDRRRAVPKCRGERIDGVDWLWPTAGGWALVGKPNRREQPPKVQTLRHRTAPKALESWVETHLTPNAATAHIDVTVMRGEEVRQYLRQYAPAQAWKYIGKGGDTGWPDAGVFTQRDTAPVVPDAIIVETWPEDLLVTRGRYWYPGTVADERHRGPGDTWLRYHSPVMDEPAFTIAIEVELAAKSSKNTAQKVRAHNIAMGIELWDVVVWVTDNQRVVDRVRRAVQHTGRGAGPRHLFAHPSEVGVAGSTLVTNQTTTWAWPALIGKGVTAAEAAAGFAQQRQAQEQPPPQRPPLGNAGPY